MAETAIVRGRFEDFEAFKRTLQSLKDARVSRYEAYGPTNLSELEDLMPRKGSLVRVWNTSGAFIGLSMFWAMCIATSLIYGLIVGGKPPVSNLPYIIPAYEGTILIGSIGGFLAILLYARLGTLHDLPPDYDPRFSEDSYGIDVYCKPKETRRFTDMLREAGAVEVNELE